MSPLWQSTNHKPHALWVWFTPYNPWTILRGWITMDIGKGYGWILERCGIVLSELTVKYEHFKRRIKWEQIHRWTQKSEIFGRHEMFDNYYGSHVVCSHEESRFHPVPVKYNTRIWRLCKRDNWIKRWQCYKSLINWHVIHSMERLNQLYVILFLSNQLWKIQAAESFKYYDL